MKIGFTINIGNFENIKIESSENETTLQCLKDCYKLLEVIILENKAHNKLKNLWYVRLNKMIETESNK